MVVHRFSWLPTAWLALAAGGAVLARSTSPVQPVEDTVQAASTPDDDIERLLAGAIDQAHEQVLVQAYLLSSKTITHAPLAARQHDVDVRVLADQEQMTRSGGSRVPEVASASIPVQLEIRYKNTHNKVIVVDPRGTYPVLVIGSFNFAQTTQHGNAEDILIVRGDTNLAQRYTANWQKHMDDALLYRAQ